MKTKLCGGCKAEQSITEFYKSSRDGYQSQCKSCKREQNKIRNRTPQRREYNRQFYEQLKTDGYFKDYEQRPGVKERKARQQREYSQDPRLRIRYLARWYTKRMIRNGVIEKEPCAMCGIGQSQAHHPDYEQPLLIVWLCADCHRVIHKAQSRRQGGIRCRDYLTPRVETRPLTPPAKYRILSLGSWLYSLC